MVETKILTDLEMSNLIKIHTKGSLQHKKQVKDSWLGFTEEAYAETESISIAIFIEKVNKWLKTNKIPIKVHSFNVFDEDIGGTDWEIEELVV